VGFCKLHIQHMGEGLSFFGSVKTAPQLRSLLVILLIQDKQVRGQVHHGWVVLLHIPT
jgi:hypothetical protein